MLLFELIHARSLRPIAAGLLAATLAPLAVAQGVPPGLWSLRPFDPPPVPGLSDYVVDEDAAIRLGKALFWDQQVGSDGMACASCHYHAGADSRVVHQLSPGPSFRDLDELVGAWQPAEAAPARLLTASLAWDPVRREALAVGGLSMHTMRWDGSSWTAVFGNPAPLGETALVFDGLRVIAVANGRTYRWSGQGWINMGAPAPNISGIRLALDESRGRVVAFGGFIHPFLLSDATFEWDGSTWTEMSPAHRPPARAQHAMAYHAPSAKIVLFGGDTGTPPNLVKVQDTWTWDGQDWVQEQTSHAPSARAGHSMAGSCEVMLHGGTDASGVLLGDVHQWDGSDWTSVSCGTGTGLPRSQHAAILIGTATSRELLVYEAGNTAATPMVQRLRFDVTRPGGGLSRPVELDATRTGGGGPNYHLHRSDFPFHILEDPADRDSKLLFESDDVVSSSGVFRAHFDGLRGNSEMVDDGVPVVDRMFSAGTRNLRRVEPRNTPSVINAIFQSRSFWDGRANNEFNGVDPFGPRNEAARVHEWVGGVLRPHEVALENSALASQAVGPPLSGLEMSYVGRSFPDLGRKLLGRRALQFQQVAWDDSVLASLRHSSTMGLNQTYRQMVRAAFAPRFWAAPNDRTVDGYKQIEANFSLFFGLALQLYQGTLISDETRFDDFVEGDLTALTPAERRGLDVFMGPGLCMDCHVGPDFTSAGAISHPELFPGVGEGPIERMAFRLGEPAIYDTGFYNLGVRPSSEDRGIGGQDPFGNPLSFTRQWLGFLRTGQRYPDAFAVDVDEFEEVDPRIRINPSLREIRRAYGMDRDVVDGAFKTPTLRNIELTGPFFHTGGASTLEQVVEFYNRGGNRRLSDDEGDTSGFWPNASNLHPAMVPLGLTAQEQADLVAFMKSLTDERVRFEEAPFDHPQLLIPHGHQAGAHHQLGTMAAEDQVQILPAVGARGRAPLGLPPLQPFEAGLR